MIQKRNSGKQRAIKTCPPDLKIIASSCRINSSLNFNTRELRHLSEIICYTLLFIGKKWMFSALKPQRTAAAFLTGSVIPRSGAPVVWLKFPQSSPHPLRCLPPHWQSTHIQNNPPAVIATNTKQNKTKKCLSGGKQQFQWIQSGAGIDGGETWQSERLIFI